MPVDEDEFKRIVGSLLKMPPACNKVGIGGNCTVDKLLRWLNQT
jgi:hypothetical protein